MKKLISFLLSFFFILSVFLLSGCEAIAKSGWSKAFYPDNFGDPTDEWYLVNEKRFSGTYNSPTASKAKLTAEIVIDLDKATILLFENKNEQLKNGSDNDWEYVIEIKKATGEKTSTEGTMVRGGDRIVVSNAHTLINALRNSENISVYLERTDLPATNYLFTADCSNFESLYTEELYQAALKYRESENYNLNP